MFNPSRPPLLVQPINKEHVDLFPAEAGYEIHSFSEDQVLVGYRSGWTFPLSPSQQKCVSIAPILMVRNSGGITTSSSTTTKGYAHQFCQENGQEPVCLYEHSIFSDQNNWMLIQDSVTMIWLQYGNQSQYYLGESGSHMDRIHYGKLLIRKFDVKEDIAPGFDKKADDISFNAKQLRVESNQIYLGGWSVATDDVAEDYLHTLLSSNQLARYINAVTLALKRASSDNK